MKSLVTHFVLIGFSLIVLAPFAWLVCASFKKQEDIFGSMFLPWSRLESLTLSNFRALFKAVPFARWLMNSLFLASTQTILVVTFSSLGGFALAKYRFRGRRRIALIMLATMLLPYQVLLPSSYELMYHLGWLNSYAAIIVPSAVSVFGIFLFRQAMLAVPDELLHAARVDGCSELRLWWDIALPIVRPMVGAYTLLAFLSNWNSFLWPQIILQDEAKYTLPIGLATMTNLPTFDSAYGILMAGTLLSILPVAFLFFALQKDFIAGLASGAIKG
ncbi:MAG TPA: carbohydrate ABC transporter permease [Tepidisphaeraceae bacterium]|nr:carbohydrate ABC transporter permease [Tepidisphaeraceae bacterium]